MPGQNLVESDSKREDVGSLVDLPAQQVFRRHVGGRSRHQDVLQRFRGHRVQGAVFAQRAGQSEVEELHTPRLRDHDVLRLDVAMKEAKRMCLVKRLQNLLHDLHHHGLR